MMIKKIFMACLVVFSSAVMAAGDFSLKDTTGKIHHLADYKGKWVLVNYWATWCPPCLEEIPDLVNAYDANHGKKLMIIGVAVDYQSKKEVEKYVDDMLMSYPIVLGDEASSGSAVEPATLPTTYIYAPDGKLYQTIHGTISRSKIEQLVNSPTKTH